MIAWLEKHANKRGTQIKTKTGEDRSSTITATATVKGNLSTDYIVNESRLRKLTPVESERLQTVADNYTQSVSDAQRYRMLGNGWTVDVIAHIFKHLTKQ
jgi:site-specific DNA-cytosine methylase